MENYSHQGSLIYLHLGKSSLEIKQQVQALQQQFMEEQGLLIGISQLNEYGLMVRYSGDCKKQIQNWFEKIESS